MDRELRRGVLTGLLVLCHIAAATVAHAQSRAVEGVAVCGPRSVELVLHWYGRPVEAADLIWELQGGQANKPVSLAKLAKAIRDRGFHTSAVKVSVPSTVDWPWPVVYHVFNGDGEGHFVVQVPARNGRPELFWDNRSGYSKREEADYLNRLSGIVLLTSDAPIEHSDAVALSTEVEGARVGWMRWGSVAGAGLVVASVAFGIRHRITQSRKGVAL